MDYKIYKLLYHTSWKISLFLFFIWAGASIYMAPIDNNLSIACFFMSVFWGGLSYFLRGVSAQKKILGDQVLNIGYLMARKPGITDVQILKSLYIADYIFTKNLNYSMVKFPWTNLNHRVRNVGLEQILANKEAIYEGMISIGPMQGFPALDRANKIAIESILLIVDDSEKMNKHINEIPVNPDPFIFEDVL